MTQQFARRHNRKLARRLALTGAAAAMLAAFPAQAADVKIGALNGLTGGLAAYGPVIGPAVAIRISALAEVRPSSNASPSTS